MDIVVNQIVVNNIWLFYYPEEHLFRTEDGQIVWNMYPLIHPNLLHIFYYQKKTMEFYNAKYGIRVHLLYPKERSEI